MSIRRSPWMGRKMSSCWGCIPVFQFCFRGFGGSSFHLCRWGYAPITRIIYSHGVRGWANPAITEVRATHCIHPYVYLIANLLRSWLPEGSRNDMCMFFSRRRSIFVGFGRLTEVDILVTFRPGWHPASYASWLKILRLPGTVITQTFRA